MKRSLISVLLIFILSCQSVFAFNFHRSIEVFSDSASVENLYRYHQCNERDETLLGLEENYPHICNVLKQSSACENFPEDDLIECESFEEENNIDLLSFRALAHCAWGLLNSLKDLFLFLKDAILGSLGYLFNSDKRSEVNEAIGEYTDSFKQYVALEYDKQLDEGHSKARASMNIAGTLLKDLLGKLASTIEEEYFSLGCLKPAKRTKRVCKIIGDITLPPAAALAILFKTQKVLLNRSLAKIETENTRPLALNREIRDIDPEKIESPSVVKALEEGENALLNSDALAVSARDLGIDLNFISLNQGRNSPTHMINPTFEQIGTTRITRQSPCHTFTYLRCQNEFDTEIKVTYLNEAGVQEVKKLTGADAVIFQQKYNQLNARKSIIDNPGSFYDNFTLAGARELSNESKDSLMKWSLSLNSNEMKKLSELDSSFNKSLSEINDPSSLINSFKSLDGLEGENKVVKELLRLMDLRVRDGPTQAKFKGINSWVKSPEHALFLHQKLYAEGIEKNWDLIRYLTDQNEYFKKALPVRGSPKTFVTYAFEKEGKSNEISLYYRNAKYDDEQWLALSEEKRIELLRKATPELKDDVPYEAIAPTAFRPNYLGKYTEETHSATNKSYVWEIKSKQYEIDQEQIRMQMAETAKLAGDTKGFHSHVVFEMPNNYEHFDDFGLWTKQVNDYLYLRGMEEGLHGGVETNIMRFAEENSPRRKKSYNENIPESLTSLKRWSHKGFTMAVRGEIYGPAVNPNSKKVGLELRDVSRDIDSFDESMGKVAQGVSDFRWENIDASTINRADIGFLSPRAQDLSRLIGRLSDNPQVVKILSEAEPYGAIPLKRYEDMSYLNYRTGQMIRPSPEKRITIINARKNYIRELEKTVRNLEDMIRKGESFETEDIQMTIQMDLTEWAKKAQISELFEGID